MTNKIKNAMLIAAMFLTMGGNKSIAREPESKPKTEQNDKKSDFQYDPLQILKSEVNGHKISDLLLMPISEFINAIKSDEVLTDIDSIQRLSNNEKNRFISEAKKRPLRIEFEVFKLNKIKDVDELTETGKTFHYYINSLNLIHLTIFEPFDESDTKISEFCNIMNNEMKYSFVHEFDHLLTFEIDMSGITPEQSLQIALNMELSAPLKECIAKRYVYLKTKDFSFAFPKISYVLGPELMKEVEEAFKTNDIADKNIFKANKFKNKIFENTIYLEYLYENKDQIDLKFISVSEIEAMFKSILIFADKNFTFYIENRQFSKSTLHIYLYYYEILIKKYREFLMDESKGKAIKSNPMEFKYILNNLYNFDMNLLVSDTKNAYVVLIYLLYKNKNLQIDLYDTKNKYATIFSNIKKLQDKIYNIQKEFNCEFDVSKSKEFSSADITYFKKILKMESR